MVLPSVNKTLQSLGQLQLLGKGRFEQRMPQDHAVWYLLPNPPPPQPSGVPPIHFPMAMARHFENGIIPFNNLDRWVRWVSNKSQYLGPNEYIPAIDTKFSFACNRSSE